MEQLGLEGMPTRLFSCTPSRLTTWLDCPRRYRMTYVDRPSPAKGLPWAHNSVGTSVHLALAKWWELPRHRRVPEAGRGLVHASWQTEGFESPEQAERWKGYAADQVVRYLEDVDPAAEPRGTERTVAFKTQTLAVSGRVDRVDERDGELVVVDYKTGRSTLSEADARGSLALALYVLGARRTFRTDCTRVELHHLPSGQVHGWDHSEETLERHVRRAEAIAAEATAATASGDDEAFPPRPSSMCGWCDYAQHCPEGLEAAGGIKKPWSGLAEERFPESGS